MAAHDRDYMREPGPSGPGAWLGSLSLTARLILLNALVFLVWLIPAAWPFMVENFQVSATGLLQHWRVWTLISSGFSHAGLLHLLVNMSMLWVVCPELEVLYGRRNVAALYVMGAAGASLAHVGLTLALGTPAVPMLGASGAVLALVCTLTLITPQRRLLLFGILPIPLWGLALGFAAISVAGVASEASGMGSGGIAHAGHLGGAAVGVAFKLLDLRPFREGSRPSSRRSWFRRKPRIRVLPPLPPEERPAPQEEEQAAIDADTATRVDELLRKINREGLESLSPEERAFLDQASAKYKR